MSVNWRHVQKRATNKPTAQAVKAQNYLTLSSGYTLCPVLPYKTLDAALRKAIQYGKGWKVAATFALMAENPNGWVIIGPEIDGTRVVRGRVVPGETVKTINVRRLGDVQT